MTKTRKAKAPTETPPNCACCERPADGSLYISFSPYKDDPIGRYGDPPKMDRSWSVHMPICGDCVRRSVQVNVKLDLKDASRAYGTVDKP